MFRRRQEFEVTSSGVSQLSSAARLSQISIAMAPLSGQSAGEEDRKSFMPWGTKMAGALFYYVNDPNSVIWS